MLRTTRRNHKTLFGAILLAILILPALASAAGDEEADTVLRTKNYYYRAFNRRDPFRGLISGEIKEVTGDLVDIKNVKLVGVLTGDMQKYAMLEDKNGIGYILKAGDPVRNGSIVSVSDKSLIARISMYGQTNRITLSLQGIEEKGDKR
jgi:hypothetical protein